MTGRLVSLRTVELVQRTWTRLMVVPDATATLFYDRLFELDPSIKPLFKAPLEAQKSKLLQMLGLAVDSLSTPALLPPLFEQLGARHASYGVQEHHYEFAGTALLWALREGLGDAFNAEVESAWREVYGFIAGLMKKGAASSAHTQPLPAVEPVTASGARERRESRRTISYGQLLVSRLAQSPAATAQLRLEQASPATPAGLSALSHEARDAPAQAPSPAAGSIPLSATQDVTLHVKLDPAPFVQALASRPEAEPHEPLLALVPAMLVALLCTVVSLGGILALGETSPRLFYAVPITTLVLTLVTFSLGYLWGHLRAGSRQTPKPPR